MNDKIIIESIFGILSDIIQKCLKKEKIKSNIAYEQILRIEKNKQKDENLTFKNYFLEISLKEEEKEEFYNLHLRDLISWILIVVDAFITYPGIFAFI